MRAIPAAQSQPAASSAADQSLLAAAAQAVLHTVLDRTRLGQNTCPAGRTHHRCALMLRLSPQGGLLMLLGVTLAAVNAFLISKGVGRPLAEKVGAQSSSLSGQL